ncbi:MAG: hypothetical protein AMR96_03060 [Candidatus Adiutrix intracellularis]|jgi:hypothetical protein|nr:MAG: hypothetical protein AMR96_03060 [Candidatus Adiutrix intracellularis]MDR2826711.1 hypothetical protein [Candidatus Adiutrix intracellularis]
MCDPLLASNAAIKLTNENLTLILGYTCSKVPRSTLSVYINNALVIPFSATKINLIDYGATLIFSAPRPAIISKIIYS